MNTLTAHRNECVHDTRFSKLDSVKGLSVFHIIFIAVAGEAQFLLLGIEQLSCLDRPTWLNLGCVPDLSNRPNSERGSCMHKLDAKSCRRLRTHAHAHPSGPFLATVCSKSPILTNPNCNFVQQRWSEGGIWGLLFVLALHVFFGSMHSALALQRHQERTTPISSPTSAA